MKSVGRVDQTKCRGRGYSAQGTSSAVEAVSIGQSCRGHGYSARCTSLPTKPDVGVENGRKEIRERPVDERLGSARRSVAVRGVSGWAAHVTRYGKQRLVASGHNLINKLYIFLHPA
ncbi:hypothetical protein PUN28_020702 [Cardiocondyla obscurior]|uniref:Uncharacterized protein n=1 Tax=Cardiocondyla obscurior TaxID=286306 RepID=A0AAW2E8Z9_9HYME